MSPQAQFEKFAQSIYLVMRGRYFDDLSSDDGQIYLQQVADWADQFCDELETMTDEQDLPVDWRWSRQYGFTLGTAREGQFNVSIDSSIYYLIADDTRYVQVLQDGVPVSNWVPVAPENISNKKDRVTQDMVTLINGSLVFSRPFRETEHGGTIVGDVSTSLPRPTTKNMNILKLVKPRQLLILGVAKNATLPDIVRGGLTPSYTQKYTALLKSAIARNRSSAAGQLIGREDYGYVSGVGF